MAVNTDIKELLKAIGFVLEDGKKNVWKKIYSDHSNYKLSVEIEAETINYGASINIGDKTTSNFKADENFVVLECVNRLLEKGYSPENITLEKDFPLGHKTKGKLDILVTDIEGKAYLMIECKTFGAEFEKANKKTIADGGQLFSYYQQDKSAKYLCLYASKLDGNTIKYQNSIIKVEEYFSLANNAKEAFEKWNKNLKDNGIFEAWTTPYNVSIKSLTKESLKPLTKEDSSRIFNQFAEILRHNVVSDKPNAFNKLITLLLCKIVDEEKGENEELHFQWLENDTNIDLQKRLNDLYKIGMSKYLTKTVTDYSDQDVDEIIGLDDTQKDIIKKMMTELRLKKNNEFAFKEVFNDASFEENSKVLREVVDLFQPYKVRYNKKQQFLGDFFELLLNTSIKQEAGQYFTPVPIARFIINSIPFLEMVKNKIAQGDSDFLPYIIDFACGSGHFLTEAMDEVHNIICELNKENKFRPEIKKKLKIWSEDDPFAWAYDFIYGIEKDYRLVKTAKVSCFLNGDGLAQIYNADGLASFKTSDDYHGKLKEFSKNDPNDNQQFDVLIANPPYSVSAFKNTLINGNISFDLYNRLTDTSSEIECLFIERTKQLMKDGGFVGIILPSSILSNSGVYEDAREIIFKYFEIVSIVEFSSNTFMATGTNTVTLFLRKRNNTEWQKIQHIVTNFFVNLKDVACNGIEKPFSDYVKHVFKTISLEDYITFINRKPNENIQKHEIYLQYTKWFDELTTVKNIKESKIFKLKSLSQQQAELNHLFFDLVIKKEKEKALYFILASPQKVVLIKSNPDNKNESEKAFLGYEFSNRRGHEGIKAYGGPTIQDATKLYDEVKLLNPQKANTYIYKAFLNEFPEVDETLQRNVFIQDLVELMTFDRIDFIKNISLSVKKKAFDYVEFWKIPNSSLKSLQEIAVFAKGTSITNNKVSEGNIPVIAGGKNSAYSHNKSNFDGNVITVSASGANAGYVWYHDYPIFASDCSVIKSKDENVISTKLLAEFLTILQPRIYQLQKGQAQPHVYISDLNNVLVPVPSPNIQQKIVEEIDKIEKYGSKKNNIVSDLQEKIARLIDGKQISNLQKLGDINVLLKRGKSPKYGTGSIQIIKSGQARGYYQFDFKDRYFLDSSVIKDERILQKGDILINSTGVGTAGRVTLFDIDGEYTVDSHITILRPKLNIALPKYILYSLAQIGFKNIEKMALGQSGQIELSLEIIKNIQIPLPSISKQQEILLQIEKLENEIGIHKKFISTVDELKKGVLKKFLE
jgi:type I restriction enzyme M protein